MLAWKTSLLVLKLHKIIPTKQFSGTSLSESNIKAFLIVAGLLQFDFNVSETISIFCSSSINSDRTFLHDKSFSDISLARVRNSTVRFDFHSTLSPHSLRCVE